MKARRQGWARAVFLLAAAGWLATCDEPRPAPTATDGRLEIRLAIDPAVGPGHIRTARLAFRNASADQLRICMPLREELRAKGSVVVLDPAEGEPLVFPAPVAHEFLLVDADYPLLAPGESREFVQRFTLDDPEAGSGGPGRRRGFEAGQTVEATWHYENLFQRCVDVGKRWHGLPRPAFGGGLIPDIWLGKLAVTTTWVVPD